VDDLWATKSEDVWLIVHTVSFQDIQPMWLCYLCDSTAFMFCYAFVLPCSSFNVCYHVMHFYITL